METKQFTDEIVYQWQKTWSQKNLEELVESCERDTVSLPYYRKYLSKDGLTLECGCGLGQWVIYLNRLGYKMAGVEIVPECIQICKQYFPDAEIYVGDVRQLPFPDQHFIGYISIGVFEHMIEGSEQTIKEMKRVLKPGGIAIITVPAFNYFMRAWYPLRQILVNLFRTNKTLRKLLGKAIYSGDVQEFKSKLNEIKSRVRNDFYPIIGVDSVKGPLFIEYKYKKGQIEKLLGSLSFEIIESIPIYHPLVFKDNFGSLFFKKSQASGSDAVELNAFGKILCRLFHAISPHFFNYVYLYVVKVKIVR